MTPELILNIGYFLNFLALVVKDILKLRIMIVISQFIMIYYATYAHNKVALFWYAVFVVINIVWIILIILERMPIKLHGKLAHLYQDFFAIMTPQEFIKIWDLAEKISLDNDQIIIKEFESKNQLMLIYSGEAIVRKDGKTINTLSEGSFIGEMSYLTQGKAFADVLTEGQVELAIWTRKQLEDLAQSKPNLWNKIQAVIGKDLIKKIVLTSEKVVE